MFGDIHSFVNMPEITPQVLKPGNRIVLNVSLLTKFTLTVLDSERISTGGVTYCYRYEVDAQGRSLLILSHFKEKQR